jgi:nucleoside-diphosphate-sugar epimerase
MPPSLSPNAPVLVTGASGFIASWIVQYLLHEGYTVYGTVRDTSRPEKVAHLMEMRDREQGGKLKLFEADLLDDGSFAEAMKGCELVIHTASPFFISGIKDAQKQLVDPALQGTRNVLNTASQSPDVKRVVLTSSAAAIYGDASDKEQTENGVFTEAHWNTSSSLTHQPYSYSKTVAEREAWKLAEQQDQWDLVVINPAFVMGPSLSQRKDATSTDTLLQLAGGQFKSGAPALYFGIVDVRDVAQAHIVAGFTPGASGRHILSDKVMSFLDMAQTLRREYNGQLPLPKGLIPKPLAYIFGPMQGLTWKFLRENWGIPIAFDNSRSQADLDLTYRPAEQALLDSVADLKSKGWL